MIIAHHNIKVLFEHFSYQSKLIIVEKIKLKDFPKNSLITNWKEGISEFIQGLKSFQETLHINSGLDKEIFDEYILMYLCNNNAHGLEIE
jgi:hypothetical protein